jgi:anti-anti-sigma factor
MVENIAMNIAKSEEAGALVVALDGRLDTNSSAALETSLVADLDAGAKAVVVDFTKLAYISSAGLRVLLMTAKRIKGSGGKLALCALGPNIQEVFKVSGFDKILSVVPSRAEALRAVT